MGEHQEVLDSGASFKVHLYPILAANVLNAVTKSTVVGKHYVGLLVVVYASSLCWSLVGVLFLGFHLYLVESPGGVFTLLSALFRCSSFCSSCGVGADGLCSMLQGTNHTILGMLKCVDSPTASKGLCELAF